MNKSCSFAKYHILYSIFKCNGCGTKLPQSKTCCTSQYITKAKGVIMSERLTLTFRPWPWVLGRPWGQGHDLVVKTVTADMQGSKNQVLFIPFDLSKLKYYTGIAKLYSRPILWCTRWPFNLVFGLLMASKTQHDYIVWFGYEKVYLSEIHLTK